MPISKENLHRYPTNWRSIREMILLRAGFKCEGSPAYPDCRAQDGAPHPVTRSRVVLTIGHLNHTPEDNRSENLRAWCQRCHCTFDAAHHAETARKTREKRAGQERLPYDAD